jgi:hypothetical protein
MGMPHRMEYHAVPHSGGCATGAAEQRSLPHWRIAARASRQTHPLARRYSAAQPGLTERERTRVRAHMRALARASHRGGWFELPRSSPAGIRWPNATARGLPQTSVA